MSIRLCVSSCEVLASWLCSQPVCFGSEHEDSEKCPLCRQFHYERQTRRAFYVCSDYVLLFHLFVKTQAPV